MKYLFTLFLVIGIVGCAVASIIADIEVQCNCACKYNSCDKTECLEKIYALMVKCEINPKDIENYIKQFITTVEEFETTTVEDIETTTVEEIETTTVEEIGN